MTAKKSNAQMTGMTSERRRPPYFYTTKWQINCALGASISAKRVVYIGKHALVAWYLFSLFVFDRNTCEVYHTYRMWQYVFRGVSKNALFHHYRSSASISVFHLVFLKPVNRGHMTCNAVSLRERTSNRSAFLRGRRSLQKRLKTALWYA